jgi:hypothetical protein
MPKETVISRDADSKDEFVQVVDVLWGRDAWSVQVVTTWATAGGGRDDAKNVYVSLSRTGVNSLIRALRKARDQAFGADA